MAVSNAKPDSLHIVYWPARKNIEFELYENGEPVSLDRYDTLLKYSKEERGHFVLANHGNDFLDDILQPFPTKPIVPVSIRTAREDYEDFKLMVKSYNSSPKATKIQLRPLEEKDELLSMSDAYEKVREVSCDMSGLLDDASCGISKIKCDSDSANEYISKLVKKIHDESDKIKKVLRSMDDDKITLCFIGAFSSGKSSLINALLGYRILPEDIESKTAKMMQITGVPSLEDCYIEFSDKKKTLCARIAWDVASSRLVITEYKLVETIKKKLESDLDSHASEALYEQVYSCLDLLNGMDGIPSRMTIGFPIPLDKNGLHYTIIDTPGTDSNYGEHKIELKKALNRQTHSISVFVIKPDGLEGQGNCELLNEILAKNSEGHSMIDMEQSFFVINKMDPPSADKYKLENGVLKGSASDVSLSDRKLFFLSAKQAYAVRAKLNSIMDDEMEDFYNCNVDACYKSKYGKYYTHNHCGSSQYATNRMIQAADAALAKAEKEGNEDLKYLVCSGIYSLEDEIRHYGRRYASSLKTGVLIKNMESASNCVSGILKGLQKKTDSKQEQQDTQMQQIKKHISETEAELSLPPDILKKDLGIDSSSFYDMLVDPVLVMLKSKLPKFLKLFKVHLNEEMEQAVRSEISSLVSDYNAQYKKKRIAKLEAVRDKFIKSVVEHISSDESISDDLKEHVKNSIQYSIRCNDMGLSTKVDDAFEEATVIQYEQLKGIVASFVNGLEKGVHELEKIVPTKSDDSQSDAPQAKKTSEESGKAFVQGASKMQKAGQVLGEVLEKGKEGLSKVSAGAIAAAKVGADLLKKGNDSLQDWETRTVSQDEFIKEIKDFLYEKQEAVTDNLTEGYTEACNRMCKEIRDDFLDNIELYSQEISLLKNEKSMYDELLDYIEKLWGKVEAGEKVLKSM